MSLRNLWLAVPLAFIALTVCSQFVSAADKEPTAEQLKFFESKIRPLFVKHCTDCHGEDEQESELRLDTLAGMLKGGKAGPSITPGKPKQSLIITAVRHDDAELRMPPDDKISKTEIADLTRWVEMGAPHPDSGKVKLPVRTSQIDLEAAKQHWAFRKPVKPAVPAVSNQDWVNTPVDHFILADLQKHGLTPSGKADKRTLIRRATYDLTGLPPTPEEIANFLQDDSPNAFAKVVDRLLASKHYGERYGRHWLDVVRYADSNGLDENVAHGNAWRYRDYVVNSFNRNKPINRFLMEQIAGDLMPYDTREQHNEQLVATGFLALGPKVLAEPDKMKMEMDIIDEQVDTFGRAFMGLTLGCARCHEHKFDPIRTEDYYALAGVFKSTQTMESFKTIARWTENTIGNKAQLAAKAEYDKKVAAQQQRIDEQINQANQQLIKENGPDYKLPDNPETHYSDETKARLKALKAELAKLEKTAPEMPTAMGVVEGKVGDIAVHIRGSHLTLGEVVDRGVPVVLLDDKQLDIPDSSSGRLQMAHWLVDDQHPLTSRVFVNRVWRWHFGRGLVPTTDNFGLLGTKPNNQALLDWLAVWFQEHNWSMKTLHRMIMLSATYQMTSDYNQASAAIDPDNLHWWRRDVLRLEAEAIRDALLAVSGQLDKTLGGPSSLGVENRKHVFNHTSEDATTYNINRRSLYLPIIRNNLYEVFTLFDYADASLLNGNRSSTIVAPQALFMMNSDVVTNSAEQLARNILTISQLDDRSRIERIYQMAYGRLPSRKEVARAKIFLQSYAQTITAADANPQQIHSQMWRSLCHVILAANEFIYIR